VCSACFARRQRADQHVANLAEISTAVALAEPGLARAQISAAMRAAAPGLRESGQAVRALRAEPGALSSAGSTAPAIISRLVEALMAVGATQVRLPTCIACHRSTWLTQRQAGQRICRPCAAARRLEVCRVCARQRPVAARHPDGRAICSWCRVQDPAHQLRCDGCGQLSVMTRRLADGTGLCRRCWGRPLIICADCGAQAPCYGGLRRGHPRCAPCGRRRQQCSGCGRLEAPVAAQLPGGPVCFTCWERALLAKAVCGGCGQTRRPDPRHAGPSRCSDCAGLAPLQVCVDCSDETRIYEAGRCRRCVLARRANALLAGADGAVMASLVPLVDALAATEPAKAGLRWIARPETAALLGALGRGELAMSHAALDELGDTKAIGHLRSVLVAAGVLGARDENLARLEAWLGGQVAAVAVPEDRHTIDTYATWWVLRRYRQRAQRRPIGDTGSGRGNITAAIGLCQWLRAHDRSLATATQADIDLWTATVSGHRRRAGHDFLRWATRHRLVHDIAITRRADRRPTVHPAPALIERAELAQRLLHDDAVALADRVAALLVILYAQPLATIVRLTIDDVTISAASVLLSLGRDPIELPEPLGALVAGLASARTGRATVAADTGPWLFPGGRPGRHLGSETLSGRLQRLGVWARAWRTNTLLDLASDMPLVALADLLGLHTTTAYRWVQAAGGEWANYAADRIRSG